MPPKEKISSVLSKLRGFSNGQKGKMDTPKKDYSLDSDAYYEQEPTVAEWARSIAPTSEDALQYVSDLFPCSKWIFNYNLQWLIGDVVAGITVGAVVVPQGMAYSKLAQLPVEYGLYTSFFGALCYWVFGTSKDINIGPVAVASIVTGSIITEVHHDLPDASPAILGSAVAMLCGSIICLVGLLQLGWLVDLISLPAVSAFITGSALTIAVGQVPSMLGIRGISSRDPAYRICINIFKRLGHARIAAAMGITALALLYFIKYMCGRAAKKYPSRAKFIFFISTLRTVLVILLYTFISYLVNRQHPKKPTFSILGFIPRGFQKASPPKIDLEIIKALASQLPAATIVLLIEHISIAKSFGRVNNYTINANSELIAIGVTNVLGPFLGAYAATGSFSRTAINSKAGSRTPLAGVITAIVVLLALYTLTPVFFYVPTSSLAAVIIHAVSDLVTSPYTLYKIWKISPFDVFIFFAGVSISLFSSIENGIFATIAISIALLLFRFFKARGRFLGHVKVRSVQGNDLDESGFSSSSSWDKSYDPELESARNIYLPLDRKDGSNPRVELERPYPGIFIYRFTEGFNYTNANNYIDYMVRVVMEETRPTNSEAYANPSDRPWNDSAPRRNKTTGADIRPTLKAMILDFSSVNHVDLTSVQTLIDVRYQLDRHAAPNTVQWHFACIHNRWTKRALAAAGFGFPSPKTDDGEPQHWKSIFSVAEVAGEGTALDPVSEAVEQKRVSKVEDVERATWNQEEDKITATTAQFSRAAATNEMKKSGTLASQVVAVHGMNRPFFHIDIHSAVRSAVACEELRLSGTSTKDFAVDKEHEK